MRYQPHHPAYSPVVAKDRAWREYHVAAADLGPDHPKTLALWGRVEAHDPSVRHRAVSMEQKPGPDVVAWYRESGRTLGFWNRGKRGAPCPKSPTPPALIKSTSIGSGTELCTASPF